MRCGTVVEHDESRERVVREDRGEIDRISLHQCCQGRCELPPERSTHTTTVHALRPTDPRLYADTIPYNLRYIAYRGRPHVRVRLRGGRRNISREHFFFFFLRPPCQKTISLPANS